EDVNINVSDMEQCASETNYVTGISSRPGGSGDPSPVTAWGVFHGMKAAVRHRLGKESVKGLKVAVQGAGAVGKYLCGYLSEEGAEIIISDIDAAKTKAIADKFKAKIVDGPAIFSADVDVFAPCALGAIINDETIPLFKCPIIAGGANNQLLDENKHGKLLRDKKILYAPDYVINAGGLINVYNELRGYNAELARKQAAGIYETLLQVFQDADKQGISTHAASNAFAERRLSSVRSITGFKHTYDNQSWIRR
ncbi:MAG: Glu/Leu/Phe/Val dehydrogenase family protein, partial [Proteobacteria bacterium]|nr:Glu/Leu/Phe/Val dehydrogenase family protein [Pseudomonadota bacterium]